MPFPFGKALANSSSLICGGCSSIGRALDCGSRCCGFESHHPPHSKVGDRGYPRSPLDFILGRRQVVRQGTLTPSPAGSNPAVPASRPRLRAFINIESDPVAQQAEQLPFKQWVRGSNPRRVTSKKHRHWRCFFAGDMSGACGVWRVRRRAAARCVGAQPALGAEKSPLCRKF